MHSGENYIFLVFARPFHVYLQFLTESRVTSKIAKINKKINLESNLIFLIQISYKEKIKYIEFVKHVLKN